MDACIVKLFTIKAWYLIPKERTLLLLFVLLFSDASPHTSGTLQFKFWIEVYLHFTWLFPFSAPLYYTTIQSGILYSLLHYACVISLVTPRRTNVGKVRLCKTTDKWTFEHAFVRFRQNNNLVRKTYCFCLKYLSWSPQTGLIKNIRFSCHKHSQSWPDFLSKISCFLLPQTWLKIAPRSS